MFRASSCPSSGAYQLQQQPLVYRRNVVVAMLLVVVGPAVCILDELPATLFGVCYTNKHRHMEAAGDQYMYLTYYVPVPVDTRCNE